MKFDKLILYSLILSFLGFLDAVYLTILNFQNSIPPCTISGCEIVLTSEFAKFMGIPIALFGSIFYVVLIVVCLLILTNFKKVFLDVFYLLAGAGLVSAIILLYIQGYILNAFCQYCIINEVISIAIAILAFLKFRKDKKIK